MKSFLQANQGQAFAELAAVSFLFVLFLLAVLQLLMLGSSQIRCQLAARRAAWQIATYNTLNFQAKDSAEISRLAPGYEIERIEGNREQEGKTITLACQVPSVGFFRLFKPAGFRIRAKSAVIAYTETPASQRLIQDGCRSLEELLDKLH